MSCCRNDCLFLGSAMYTGSFGCSVCQASGFCNSDPFTEFVACCICVLISVAVAAMIAGVNGIALRFTCRSDHCIGILMSCCGYTNGTEVVAFFAIILHHPVRCTCGRRDCDRLNRMLCHFSKIRTVLCTAAFTDMQSVTALRTCRLNHRVGILMSMSRNRTIVCISAVNAGIPSASVFKARCRLPNNSGIKFMRDKGYLCHIFDCIASGTVV